MKYLFPNDFLTFIMNVEYNRNDFTLYILIFPVLIKPINPIYIPKANNSATCTYP